MRSEQKPKLGWDEAAIVLGVDPGAGDEALRAAYLEKVRLHPPDREPDLFESIRDAYEQLRDPALRAKQVLDGPNPSLPLPTLLENLPRQRKFVGMGLWMELLKEKRL